MSGGTGRRHAAEQVGLTDQEDYDAAADNDRQAVVDSNWVVVVQDPLPGSLVTSAHVKFGRIKKIEAKHFLEGLSGYVVALTPPPVLPTSNDLFGATITFCDDLNGGHGSNTKVYGQAVARLAENLAKIQSSTAYNELALAGAIAGPATDQFCSDAQRRVPASVTTTAPPAPPVSTSPPTPTNEDAISLAEFTALAPGMSYEQAVAIIGGPGVLQSEVTVGGLTDDSYRWDGGFLAGATVIFQNNALIAKSQLGLS